MYLLVQLGSRALIDLGRPEWAQIVDLVWLGLAAYSWFAPVFFPRMFLL